MIHTLLFLQGARMSDSSYSVLLFYKFVSISDPTTVTYDHLAVCKAFGLLGRIYISKEGINGTCAGTPEAVTAYMRYMNKHPLFADTDFKKEDSEFLPFRKMFVREKQELVALRVDEEVTPFAHYSTHLSPESFHEMATTDPDAVLVDVRNLYEYEIGHFEGAIPMQTSTFKELPKTLEQLKDKKDKKLLMYCTGGIRCEKAAPFFKQHGFDNVYQLHGGIVRYGQKIEKERSLFKGKCFVFDDRISVPVTDDVLAACTHCGTSCDRYLNCTNAECNKLFICCDSCKEAHHHACSATCAETPRADWKRADQAMSV